MNDTATQPGSAPAAMLQEIQALAARKRHNLHKSMLGTQPLSLVSARLVLARLASCEDREPVQHVAGADGTPLCGAAAPRGQESRSAARTRGPGFKELGDQVDEARYATPSLTGNQDYDFWKVEKGTGKWEGYTFVRRVLGGQEPQDISSREQYAALRAIVEMGPEESRLAFGRELGICPECGSELTNEASRAAGIGPVCAQKRR